jgi:predicted MFS family arabinose efflux permease
VTTQTFIGNSYQLDKKAKAIGWVTAASTLANAVGAPVAGYMTGISSWRSVLIWLMLPAAVASLVFVFVVFPRNLPESQHSIKEEPFMKGFKQVLTNKSAVACLVQTFLINASVFGGMVFEVTFYRQVFLASPGFAALIGPTAGTALITVGAVIGGHTVNRVGRKRLGVIAAILSVTLAVLTYFIPNLWLRVGFRWTTAFLGGISVAALVNLMLEQAPRFRGTAMSLCSAFAGVGTAIGIAVAGAALNLYINPTLGFQALGLAMGAFGFAAVFVILFFAKDPIKSSSTVIEPSGTSDS